MIAPPPPCNDDETTTIIVSPSTYIVDAGNSNNMMNSNLIMEVIDNNNKKNRLSSSSSSYCCDNDTLSTSSTCSTSILVDDQRSLDTTTTTTTTILMNGHRCYCDSTTEDDRSVLQQQQVPLTPPVRQFCVNDDNVDSPLLPSSPCVLSYYPTSTFLDQRRQQRRIQLTTKRSISSLSTPQFADNDQCCDDDYLSFSTTTGVDDNNNNNNNNDDDDDDILMIHNNDTIKQEQDDDDDDTELLLFFDADQYNDNYDVELILPKNAAQENERLNLYLGQTKINPKNVTLLWIVSIIDYIWIRWYEQLLYKTFFQLPLSIRQQIYSIIWHYVYFPLHQYYLGCTTGIHLTGLSPEYHALTTLFWLFRLLPMNIERMRFGMTELKATCINRTITNTTTTTQRRIIDREYIQDDITDQLQEAMGTIPSIQKDFCTVKGLFLHNNTNNNSEQMDGSTNDTKYTIFWLYGGAFMAGDPDGNSSHAEMVSLKCNVNIFLPEYRLAPEYTLEDMLWDTALAYKWLVEVKHCNPNKILLLGTSSGAALNIRLMQYFAELQRQEILLPDYIAPLLSNELKRSSNDDDDTIPTSPAPKKKQYYKASMPGGCVAIGPFADFTEQPWDGSFYQYCEHDLIVSSQVMNFVEPHRYTHMNGKPKEHSPVHRSMEGLSPICFILSEHEVVYDMSIQLLNRAKQQGVHVTLGLWKYMCHVFPFFNGFVPEAQQSWDFICNWINEQQQNTAQHELHVSK